MAYQEKSVRLALDSTVAVLALGNPECTDLELLPLRPRTMSESERDELKARWHGRNLQSIGVVGLVGTTPQFALKQSLQPEQISLLADAFLQHVYEVYCDGLAQQTEAELRRLWSLPDTRLS
jgi:hypothetical protein